MKRTTTGRYVTTTVHAEPVRAFVPDPLPPSPPLAPDHDLVHQIDRANVALGRLDGASTTLPDTHLARLGELA